MEGFHYMHVFYVLIIISAALGFLAIKVENLWQQIAISLIAGSIIFIAAELLHFM
jgi:hypothetical protein